MEICQHSSKQLWVKEEIKREIRTLRQMKIETQCIKTYAMQQKQF